MSTDWQKYSTPAQSRGRGRVPSDNGIISLNVGVLRAIKTVTVVHSPCVEFNNRAHTDVDWTLPDEEVRVKLKRAAELKIPLGA